jgi:hypothetical protein
LNSKPNDFSDFSFEIHSESKEDSIEKVPVAPSIFFQIFGAWEAQIWIGQSLENFEYF